MWELGGGFDLFLMVALGTAVAAGWLSVTVRAAFAARRARPNRPLAAAGVCGAVVGAGLIVCGTDSLIETEWPLAFAGAATAATAAVFGPALCAWGLRRAWADADRPDELDDGPDLSALDAPPPAAGLANG